MLIRLQIKKMDVLRLEVTDTYTGNTIRMNYINHSDRDIRFGDAQIIEETYRWQVYNNYCVLTTYKKAYYEKTEKITYDAQNSHYYSNTKIAWELEIAK